MKRTILTSFMFLYPLNKAYEYRDVMTLNMSAIGLGLSVCNHSHSWHTDKFRRKLFQFIDVVYMHSFALRAMYNSIECTFQVSLIVIMMFTMYYKLLGGKVFEKYTERDKNVHMLFHILSIYLLTETHEKCYWEPLTSAL